MAGLQVCRWPQRIGKADGFTALRVERPTTKCKRLRQLYEAFRELLGLDSNLIRLAFVLPLVMLLPAGYSRTYASMIV